MRSPIHQRIVTAPELQAMLAPSRGRIRNVAPLANRMYAGRVYHSAAEAKYAFELDTLKAAGRIKDWEPQVEVSIIVNAVLVCKLKVDFRVWPIAGNPWLIEVKGYETEVYKLKRKLLRVCHPELDYRVVRA